MPLEWSTLEPIQQEAILWKVTEGDANYKQIKAEFGKENKITVKLAKLVETGKKMYLAGDNRIIEKVVGEYKKSPEYLAKMNQIVEGQAPEGRN